ncbi:hypothetical protein [Rhizobium sp. PL01]|uniref:hypothetical protein n=1 Tax=Rhizobium sp. PL01 TaxID=3085631 RepID=UPI002981BFA1|nr:hypothetical protein [Rhizobium sp. PL01]MDW5314083.1 hypothetical protein [Rhizobium sp. PL01]
MTLRLAYDEFTLEHGGKTVTLRPSLRAVSYLEARYGFETLFRHVDEFNLTTIREIILAASQARRDAAAFLLCISGEPLSLIHSVVAAPVADLCRAFIPAAEPNAKRTTCTPVPWPEFYRELYRTATGALGWTPAEAWAATPTEINEAFIGYISMLNLSRGSGEAQSDEDKPVKLTDPDLDRSTLEALRGSIKRAGR